jgi:RNA polymerase sigma-70 factor (ECF subfamily)
MDMPNFSPVESTVNHLFRHQSGKMVAVLTRIFGSKNIQLAEDVVQDTLLTALEQWKIKGIPDDPTAWIFIVAKNKALNLIKRNKNTISFGDSENQALLQSGYTLESTFRQLAEEDLIRDDQLRMMYACCHPDISSENQVTFILKTLCGFSTAEIAKAFLTSEETISKRLYRTKEFFRNHDIELKIPSVQQLKTRTASVLGAIYLLFNEGYSSTNSQDLIRKDLISEAMLLCKLLTENIQTRLPEVFALMALMCFHAARSESRLSLEGEIILLPQQDRDNWDNSLIEKGSEYLDLAASGEEISSYHLEAAIAYEHCKAESFEKTDWKKILEYYNWLSQLSPSLVTDLNKTVAILYTFGPDHALSELEIINSSRKLDNYYLLDSLYGEIYCRLQHFEKAKFHFQKAIDLTQSDTEKKMLIKKMNLLFITDKFIV